LVDKELRNVVTLRADLESNFLERGVIVKAADKLLQSKYKRRNNYFLEFNWLPLEAKDYFWKEDR